MTGSGTSEPEGHYPVLWQSVLEMLDPRPGEVYLDMNLGRGGHLMKIAPRLGEDGRVIAIDADPDAVAWAESNLLPQIECQADFAVAWSDEIDDVLSDLQVGQVDLALFDLGVSSVQLEDPEKGFTFREEGPLLMNYAGPRGGITAAEVVNTFSEQELSDLLDDLGEERFHERIAHQIVEARDTSPIRTTSELARICEEAYPARARRGRLHPATKTFMALRLYVNRELQRLEEALPKVANALSEGGRLAAIGFMSHEIRIIRDFFNRHLPGRGEPLDDGGRLERMHSKAIKPDREEVERNPASRSAVMRVVRKVFPD